MRPFKVTNSWLYISNSYKILTKTNSFARSAEDNINTVGSALIFECTTSWGKKEEKNGKPNPKPDSKS